MGLEVSVKDVLTNTSNAPIVVFVVFKERGVSFGREYEIKVTNAEGRVGLIAAAKSIPEIYSTIAATLQRARSLEDEIAVRKRFDLRQPGKYSVKIARAYEQLKACAISNVVTITVTP